MADKWEPGASFFIMWFENIAVVVADVKEVCALPVRGEERFFPVAEKVIAFSLFAEVPGFLAGECGGDS